MKKTIVDVVSRARRRFSALLVAVLLLLCGNQAFAALPAAGAQSINTAWASGTSSNLSGFVPGFTFTNNTGGWLFPDGTYSNGFYDGGAGGLGNPGGNTTTYTVNADGTNLGYFDLTAASFPNVTGVVSANNVTYSFTFTGYPVGGGTPVTTTATIGTTPGGTTFAWTTAPNFSAFTKITGFQVSFLDKSGTVNSSNIDFTSFTIANPVAPVPYVGSVTPTSGPTAGGTAVTITGAYFTGTTSVTIGGAAATGVTVVNATTITATTPAGTAGAKNIVITNAAGTGTGTGLFTYIAPPTVTAIAPSSGPLAGGQAVTITGTNFISGATVTVGGAAATSVVVVNATTITAVTPAGTAGAKNVVVTTIGGTGTGTSLYTYAAAPTVTAISPTSGPTAGGTAVTITGTNFTGATSVTIGGAAATGVTVVSATQITATTPTGTAGAQNVAVTTPSGTGTGTGLFTYIAAPTVTSISPASGPTAGGTAVTITGANFTGATSVTIGGVAATSVTVVSATQITATTPAGTAGAQNVSVTTPGGTGKGTGLYTYVAVPAVTAILPNSGPTAGGTSVTITGTNFVAGATVTIGGAAATSVVVVNATTITAVTPAGTAGAASVVVTTIGGTAGTGNNLFTYVAAPTVSAISPTSGPAGGGTAVTITGTNFTGATSVTIGGAAATSVIVVNATTITAVTPAGAAGAAAVAVTTASGTGTGAGLFTYVAAPIVTAISPNSGSTTGGTGVTITGSNFVSGAAVTIGSAPATSVVVVNATTITAVTPAGTAGAVNVAVTTASGTGTGTGLYTYVTAPSVTGVTPSGGPLAGGTAITITGANLTGATSVTIGGVAATGLTVVNATTITATTPANTAGTKNVVVTTPAGVATGTNLFTYAAAPTANAASMNVGINSAATLDLSADITGGTATSVAVSTAPLHGTVTVSGTKVTYTAAANYVGADSFNYTASGMGGTSAAATVSVTVVTRSDPTQDAAVTGLIGAQTAAARSFREAQLYNFQQRLESRHHGLQAASRDATGVASTTRSAGLPEGRAGSSGSAPAGSAGAADGTAGGGQANVADLAAMLNATRGMGNGAATGNMNGGVTSSEGFSLLTSTLISTATTSSVNLNLGSLSRLMLAGEGQDGAGYEVWGAGNLRFGTRSPQGGGTNADFTTAGASVGVDKRFNEQITLGMGLGYARDKSTIGSDGTANTTSGNSVAAYASYQATDTMFVDALVGYGTLTFDSTRFVAAVNQFAMAGRSGSQTWASVATGYEYRDGVLLLSPYARYNLGTDQLNAATETGAGIYSLNYASQSNKSQQLSLGFRAETQKQVGWGTLLPRARIEYQHRLDNVGLTSLAYADTLGTRYDVATSSIGANAWVFGLGSGLAMDHGWSLDFEYQRNRTAGSVGNESYQAANVRLSKKF